jgi:hypothetical protein
MYGRQPNTKNALDTFNRESKQIPGGQTPQALDHQFRRVLD